MKSNREPIRVKQCREEMGLKPTMMSAILRKMHPERSGRTQWVVKAEVQQFLRDHPTFSMTEIYPAKKNHKATA